MKYQIDVIYCIWNDNNNNNMNTICVIRSQKTPQNSYYIHTFIGYIRSLYSHNIVSKSSIRNK